MASKRVPAVNLIGQRFTRLVVIGPASKPYAWICQCDCGNTSVVTTGCLTNKIRSTRSCGCLSYKIDLTGQRIAYLQVIREVPSTRYGKRYWLCLCDCGKTKTIQQQALRNGNTQSCGCKRGRTLRSPKNLPEYQVWKSMRQRCANPREPAYTHYGGRGIKVCVRWDSFAKFYADMGPRPTSRHTIDRIDNNGPYSPENCRWVTFIVQANNRRNNHHITYNGETKTISQWARIVGLAPSCLRSRIVDSGWDMERALNTPSGKPSAKQ